MYISPNSKKSTIQQSIIKILESHNYYIEADYIKKFNRLSKSQLNYFYNLVRYQFTNFTKNEVKVIFGIIINIE